MKKFKVGDKVEVVNAELHYFRTTGTITEISTKEGEIFPYYVKLDCNNNLDNLGVYHEHELKLIENKSTQDEQKFKIHDKVVILSYDLSRNGNIGIIVDYHKSNKHFPYLVEFECGDRACFCEHELKLIENKSTQDEQNMNILEWVETTQYPSHKIFQTSDKKYVILLMDMPSDKEKIIFKNNSRLKVFDSNQNVSLNYLKQICENDHLEDMKKQPTCDFPTFPITLNFFFEYPKVQNEQDEQKMGKESTLDEHDFKVGDRVQIVAEKTSQQAQDYIKPVKNLVGTIIKIDKTQCYPYYVEFERVVNGYDDKVLVFHKHELKLIENQCSNDEQKMDTESTSDEQNMFKIGDRVQIVNKDLSEHSRSGKIVKPITPNVVGYIPVLLDNEKYYYWYKQSSLKLIENNKQNINTECSQIDKTCTSCEHPFFNLFQQLEQNEQDSNDFVVTQKLTFWQRIHEIFEQYYDCDLSQDLVKIENHLKNK